VQYPNWRRKLELNLEYWPDDPRVRRFIETMRAERGIALHPPPLVGGATALSERAAIPRATYRLQFNRDFTFAKAARQVPYLAALGISHCYASPLLMARPGSSHGYDIVEHHRLNPELGSAEEFERFVSVLHEHGMGLILDMVPNHMGVMGNDNPWWLEMLENGPAAASARFFDIDWSPLKATLRGKVLLPVLGDHYGTVLEKGELTLAFDPEQGHFDIHYYEHRFPIDPGTYSSLLGHHMTQLGERLGEQDPGVLEFASLTTAFSNLPLRTESDEERLAERRRDSALHKQHLARLYRENADIACYIDEVVQAYNDTAGQAADATLLHRLLEEQPYRLAYWRVASDEINYRRFFDINDLASLRMDEPEVYEATHALVLELIAGGKVQGLRIDHPDGLYNPCHYFQRLQQSVVAERSHNGNGGGAMPLYVVVEKILAAHERLPSDWPVHGTTGYDFASLCNDLFVDASSEKALTRTYRQFSGEWERVEETRYQSKKLIMRVALSSELNVLAMQLSRIAEADTHTRDYTLNSLRSALAEVVACFPVYRTYVSDEGAAEKDTDYVKWAVGVAKKRSQAADTSVFDFLLEVLLTTIKEGKSQPYQEQVLAFAMKFQQLSAPVMAKGMEDTAFYRYNRLVSLNEVGGEPDRFGIAPAQFHRANQLRQQNWPHAMLAGSTHDSKRSEDVRARINVISEFPDEWRTLINRLARINRAKKRTVDGEPAPSRNDEYLLYQTLIGTWPDAPDAIAGQDALDAYRERIDAYMNKAIKEAKRHTSWINPNADYEEAMRQFIGTLLGKLEGNTFLATFIPFASKCARFGFYNSLAQTQLRLTAPGVPDIYQGNELPALNLVDPDSRRPVDYERSKRLFAEFSTRSQEDAEWQAWLKGISTDHGNGQAKLFLIWKLLGLRSEHPELFRDGDYQPLLCEGGKAEHLCAFAREWKKQQLISVTPRLIARLMGERDGSPIGSEVWGDTVIQLPRAKGKQTYHNLLSGETPEPMSCNGRYYFRVADLLTCFPLAVLVKR
jgi:(1->4)-alpha-D-glucan 1-alpha-D-glucosylmutase